MWLQAAWLELYVVGPFDMDNAVQFCMHVASHTVKMCHTWIYLYCMWNIWQITIIDSYLNMNGIYKTAGFIYTFIWSTYVSLFIEYCRFQSGEQWSKIIIYRGKAINRNYKIHPSMSNKHQTNKQLHYIAKKT